MSQDQVFQLFAQYAYEPVIVYGLVFVMLTASSFGLPIPEELTLISAGVVAFFGLHPDLYPPPYEGAKPIQPVPLSIVCFFAVFLSDVLIYWIGRVGGGQLRASRRLKRYVTSEAFRKVEDLTLRYGAWMSGVFRFTPGLRFPGHLTCGMMGLPFWKFCLVDGVAALLSVPTQVLLIAYYGEFILDHIKQFKIIVLFLVIGALTVFFLRKTTWVRRLWT